MSDNVCYYEYDKYGTPVAANVCVEPVSKKVERLEKELADLKARAAAEAVKPKTVGEAIAKSLSHYGSLDTSWYAVDPDRLNVSGSVTISKLAAAIDKAVEEAKAAQKAKIVRWLGEQADAYRKCHAQSHHPNYSYADVAFMHDTRADTINCIF